MILQVGWSKKVMLLILLMLALFGQGFRAREALAQFDPHETFVWTGNGVTNNWSEGANWSGGTVPTLAGTVELVFPVVMTQTTTFNDLPNYTSRTRLVLEGKDHRIEGNTIKVDEIRTTYTSGSSTMAAPLSLAPGPMLSEVNIITTDSGRLVIEGSISGSAGIRYAAGTYIPDLDIYDGGTVIHQQLSSNSPNHTYTGLTYIGEGCVVSAKITSALGDTTGKTYVDGTLDIQDTIIAEPLEIGHTTANGYLKGGSWNENDPAGLTGDIVLNGKLNFSLYGPTPVALSGAISGNGGIKLHTITLISIPYDGGILRIDGSTSNTFTGMTEILTGKLQLNKTSGAVAIPGPLFVLSKVELLSSNQIADTSEVEIWGVLDMGDKSDVVGVVRLNTGNIEGASGAIRPTDIYVENTTSSSVIASRLALGSTNHVVNVAQNATLDITGLVGGSGGKLTKTGAGILQLGNANTYSGGTEIQGGTLQVKNDIAVSTSSATGSGPVVVKSGGTLGGAGRIIGNVTVEDGGIVAPGAEYGALRVQGNVAFAATSVLNVQLNTPGVTTGGNNDYLKVTGNLTLDGILNVNAEQTTPTISNGTYYLITYTGTFTNNSLAWGSMPSGHTYSRQFLTGQFNIKVAP